MYIDKNGLRSMTEDNSDASRDAVAMSQAAAMGGIAGGGKPKMSKSKARRDRYKGTGNTVFHMSAEEATLAKMPYIDGYICRGGVHGDMKYNRRHADAEARRIIDEQR